MNPQYPNGQSYSTTPTSNPQSYTAASNIQNTYSAAYAPIQQPSAPYSRPTSNGLHLPNTQTLPPLTSVSSLPGYGNHILQPSLMNANSDAVNQNASFPIYGPTANTYFNGSGTIRPNATSQPPTQTVRQGQIGTQPPQHAPVYSSTPMQTRLPELAPRAVRDSAFPVAIGNGSNTTAVAQIEPQPTHVVGSQGRRGILPSSAGRPVAVPGANTNGQKAAPTPAKDAEGKYPCPYCNKNYLHAKHLKRHLLRHTGVRPYTCGLCKDTFSRSDILKRHFQKCSVRRGNPSGDNHLTHSRANKKREVVRLDSTTPTITDHEPNLSPFTPTSQEQFDISNLNITGPSQDQYVDHSGRVSRANSIIQSKRSSGTASNRTSLGMVNTAGYESANYAYSAGHITPDSITSSGAATPYQYTHESRSSQLSPSGTFTSPVNGISLGFPSVSSAPPTSNHVQGSLPLIAGQGHGRGPMDFDWPQFNSHDDYSNGHYPSGTNTPLRVKSEHDFTTFNMPDYPSYLRTNGNGSDTN